MEKLVDLVEEECIPCNSDMTPLTPVEYEPYMAQLEDWIIEEEKMLVKTWRFRNFEIPMDFANKITVIAEAAGHHPDLYIRWGELSAFIWTHKINGLTESDFYFAAKADREFEPFRAAAS